MQPIDYNIDVKSPFEAATQGYQTGFNQTAQQYQLAQQVAQQRQMSQDLNAFTQNTNPTAQDYASLMVKYPQLSEQFKRSWDVLEPDQQRNRLSQMTQVYSAIQSGQPQVASDLLSKYAEAYQNSGHGNEAQEAQSLNTLLQSNPDAAKTTVGLALSSALGKDQFANTFSTLQKLPLDLSKAQSEATIKDVEAQAAPENTELAQSNAAEDIAKKQLDRKLSVIDAQIKTADSETRRGDLQNARDKVQLERDKLGQSSTDLQTSSQDRLDTVNQSLDTVNKILNNPSADNGITGTGSFYGAATAKVPGSNRRELNNLIDTIKSQQFLTALQSLKSNGKGTGLGNLSNAEGHRLETAIATLDPNSKSFKQNVLTIKQTLDRLQQRIIAQGNLPITNQGTGNTFVMNHPKLGVINDAFINKLLTEHPGATREQVIQYLQKTGGQ